MNCELCYSTSNPVGDEEDTFKFFMAFDIMLYGLVLKVVVGGQIVVPQNNYNMKDICIYNLLVSFILDLLLSWNLLVWFVLIFWELVLIYLEYYN